MPTPLWTITPATLPDVIDLSDNNAGFKTPAEFRALKAQGYKEVIHKASQGGSEVDPLYAGRRELAVAAGLSWSAYHFCTNAPIAAQQAHFLSAIGAPSGIKRLALDAEYLKGAAIDPGQAAAFSRALDFALSGMSASGIFKQCLRYGNASVLEYKQPGWHDGPMWWAKYGPAPTVELMKSLGVNPALIVLWQATASGHAGGNGPVDLSYSRP